ncbi:MAG: GTPase Era [Deltaproteobacteria bacterium]|nr:GTPase Era [Deltaproteobacteria bacterium]
MTFRCGYVALIGRPNVGKSTLINRLVGESLAIVTPKPQTTRQRIVGIVQRPESQLIFVDTPGFHESAKLLNRVMLKQVDQALADADAVCLLLEPRASIDPIDRELWMRIAGDLRATLFAVINKMDLVPLAKVARLLTALRQELGREPMTLSALNGTGVEGLMQSCEAVLPEGPALYPTDQYTEHPTRFLAAEMIREQLIVSLGEELPYATAVEIEAFEEKEKLTRIRALVIVEKDSQKGIVIGQGGRTLKKIGTRARAKIETLVGTKVYLELFVRVEAGWTKDPTALRRLGYG